MLVGIVGKMGTGKTLTLTYLAMKERKKHRKIYSNYKLNFPYKPIKNLNDFDKIRNGVFCADELWLWLDSRESGQAKNKFGSKILAKSRKRGIDVYYTTQHIMQIDARVRRVTDYLIFPQIKNGILIMEMYEYYNNSMEFLKKIQVQANKLFDYYDTSEEVLEY